MVRRSGLTASSGDRRPHHFGSADLSRRELVRHRRLTGWFEARSTHHFTRMATGPGVGVARTTSGVGWAGGDLTGGDLLDEVVDGADEAFEHVGELHPLVGRERAEQVGQQHAAPDGDLGVAALAGA